MPPALSPCQAARTALYAALCQARPDAAFRTEEPGIQSRYLAGYADNLISTVPWDAIKPDFVEGAGHELDADIFAPWSSAALVANNFGAWLNASDQLEVAGHSGFNGRLRFERTFPTGLRGTPPHLDVLGLAEDGIVAVESKCLEGFCSPKAPHFQPSYSTEISDYRATSRWGEFIGEDLSVFWRLDVGQLVRHALGLMTSGSRQLASAYLDVPDIAKATPITLVYAYLEPTNADHPAWVELRAELDSFTAAVADDPYVRFENVTYPQLWAQWAKLVSPPPWLTLHLDELQGRYAIDVMT